MDSPGSHPGSGSVPQSQSASNSGSVTIKPTGNSPPPPASPPQCDKVDDINITGLSTPTKTNQSEPSLQDTAISPLCSWKKQEIHLLNDIIDFYKKNRTYPFDDSDDMRKFYNEWNETRGFCKDEDELTNKMVDLHERFLMNYQKLVSGNDIEDGMDPVETKIYRLSYKIWGKHDHDYDED